MMRRVPVVLSLVLAFASTASAHELRPAYLEVREGKPGEFEVLWKTPRVGDARLSISVEFTGDVKTATPTVTRTPLGAAVQTWTLRAPALRGESVRIRGLEGTMTDAIVRFEFADGTTWTHRLTPQAPSATIPLRPSGWDVAGTYTRIGIEHILTGIDHLLFVLALLIMTRSGWRLVKTVTAFTLSHSLTLTAATLGYVHVPPRPVEAVIALSIVFVAAEIVRMRRGVPSLAASSPWLVAFSFGLIHGLGFAGGLSDAGLPDGHIPTALLFFSLGVETGHFLFIGVVSSAIALVRRARVRLPRWSGLVPPYAIGAVAMFWVIQRTALMLDL